MKEGTYKEPSPFHYLFTFDLAHKSNITVQVRNINSIINVFKKTPMTVPHRLSRKQWCFGSSFFFFFNTLGYHQVQPHLLIPILLCPTK